MAPLCNQDEMASVLQGYKLTKDAGVLTRLMLRLVVLFWDGIPYFNMGWLLAPDLLHQLYKGMLEKLCDWIEDLLGTAQFSCCVKVKVWAGRESRDMIQQFLPIAVDAQAPAGIICMVHSLLVFSYLAHSAQLTDVDLAEMKEALATFHKA
ncbi:hypothetical protein FRC09_015618, partial [Ceratobasidium sp. 395]